MYSWTGDKYSWTGLIQERYRNQSINSDKI